MHFLSANLRELSNDDRVALSRLIVELLDRWRVEGNDQVAMLGLPVDTAPRVLRRYHENTPLPNSPEINERIDHLLGIADALRTSNPCSATADVIWLHSVNHRFENRTPLEAMIRDGLGGLLAVRTHLDCAYDWHLSGSRY
ncbi:MAG TPA: hypothetical protein DIC36_09635 [Gammaproteobacteria bacterium]|nr:hypothetical protein [Gammaproteobacteria bacterium]